MANIGRIICSTGKELILLFQGKVVEYHKGGKKKSESIFYRGVPHGPQRTFYQNKIKSSEIIYDLGIMSGVHSKWWSNGKIKEEEYWSGGEYFGGKTWDDTTFN